MPLAGGPTFKLEMGSEWLLIVFNGCVKMCLQGGTSSVDLLNGLSRSASSQKAVRGKFMAQPWLPRLPKGSKQKKVHLWAPLLKMD